MSALERFAAACRTPRRHWSLTPMAGGFLLQVGEPNAHSSALQEKWFGTTPDQAAERAVTALGLADGPAGEEKTR